MATCPNCDVALDTASELPSSAICPRCGEPFTSDERDSTWVDVARVANLAEAGFITDELIGHGIAAEVRQLDEFNAASDRWTAQYLIRVPSHSRSDAAEHIRQYLREEAPARQTVLDAFRSTVAGANSDSSTWRPVLAVLLVGIVSFALGQRFSEAGPARRPARNDLTKSIVAIGTALSTPPAANHSRYQLSFDPQQQLWKLDCDRDNDGVFDQSQHFNLAGAAL